MTVSKSRPKIALLAAGIVLAFLSLGFAFVKWPAHSTKPAAQPYMFNEAATYKDFKALMGVGVQHDFLLLQDAVQRKAPLDSRTMDNASTLAGRMDNMVRQFGSYEGQYKKLTNTPEDMSFFRQQTLQLDAAARELQDAALRRQPERVNASYRRIDQTCHDCHARFGIKTAK